MSRPERQSNPAQELSARRSWTGPVLAGGVLTPALAAFCQSGVGIALASTDRSGRPVVGRGLSCRVAADGQLRIVLRESSNTGLLRAIRDGARIAATFSQPTTHRSIQLKAAGAAIVPVAVADGPAALAQTSAFRAELVAVGYSAAFAAGYTGFEPHDLGTIEFLPEEAFVQTPGPSAGSALR